MNSMGGSPINSKKDVQVMSEFIARTIRVVCFRLIYSSSRCKYPETACNASKEVRMPNKTGSL